MTKPYLINCLVMLREEFNALDPSRDKASDGWIGDAAHAATTSDHNPDAQGRVLAIDIDATGPWPAPFGDIVESLRGDSRLEYIIWNRRIASRDRGWSWRTYTGTADPHTSHAHFSARHDHVGQNSTAPWGLEDFMPLTDAQIDEIADRVVEKIKSDLSYTPAGTTDVRKTVADIGLMETRRREMEDRLITAIKAGPVAPPAE